MAYKKRYENTTMQIAYINAYNCIYNGCSKENWDSCGLSDYDADEVWDAAIDDFFEF